MVIVPFFRVPPGLILGPICAGLLLPLGNLALAQDTITLKQSGQVLSGQITGYSAGQVNFVTQSAGGAPAATVLYADDIRSIAMATPATVSQAKDKSPSEAIAALSPLVQRFAGLPATWVPNAMAQLAEAYEITHNEPKATALYQQIDQLYSTGPFRMVALAGDAELKRKAGQPEVAISLLQPLVDQANASLAPSADEGALYAKVFLVYGRALEAEKKLPQALEAYLSVKTMFYQNGELAAQADLAAKNLLAQNPGVGVD